MSSLDSDSKVLSYLMSLAVPANDEGLSYILRVVSCHRGIFPGDPILRASSQIIERRVDEHWIKQIPPPKKVRTELVDLTPSSEIDPSFAELTKRAFQVTKPADVIKLTQDQERAWAMIQEWLKTDYPYFALKGYSGTGKSFLQQKLNQLPGYNFHFCAPTNKASKVLSTFIGERCPTVYSLLGLRMTEDEENQVLKAGPCAPDLGSKPILVIDEAGMVNKQLVQLLVRMVENKGWRVIFVGDPAQLNPIGEPFSRVWSMPDPEWRVLMREVKRFDNDLLKLSIRIRKRLQKKVYDTSPLRDQNDGNEGVFLTNKRGFVNQIKDLKLDDFKATKIGVWRNKAVKRYTEIVREGLGFKAPYEPSDLIMIGSPITAESGAIVAYTDEEFQINNIVERTVEIDDEDVEVRQMTLIDSDLTLTVPVRPEQVNDLLSKRARIAGAADGLQRKLAWKKFWELKKRFHSIRHGYAMTAHRLQGSTLDNIFIDQSDVLANPNEREAFRALYVLATRPRYRLTSF